MNQLAPETGTAEAVNGGVYVAPPGRVVRAEIWGEPVFFLVANPRDAIQRHHLAGRFYEPEELEMIRQHCPPGAVFCDVGANVGNHALFALKFLRVSRAILFEPNPAAVALLQANIQLNGLAARCDLSHLGLGLSDQPASGLGIEAPRHNLGGARMTPGAGTLDVITGDAALAGVHVDFIKIDVEAMELQVLAGLAQTIARCRPRIMVEVDNANRAAFDAWVEAVGYRIKSRHKRHRDNENFLLLPRRQAAPPAVAQPIA